MVYTFWEGEMPGYIRLCMDTWKFRHTVLNYRNVGEFADLDIEKAKRLTLPQIADYVRVHVLRDQGGYWLDADTIMITDKLPEETILGDPGTRENTIGMLHAQPGQEMFVWWARFQDRTVDKPGTPQRWSAMGNDFTDQYLKEHPEIEIGKIENCWPETYMVRENMMRRQKYEQFYFNENYRLSDIRSTDMLMLHNSWTPEWYKSMEEAEVLDHKCTLSNILKELI